MLIYTNAQFFFALLLHWKSLGVSLKWGEQIWCLNMESIKEKTLPVNPTISAQVTWTHTQIEVSRVQLEHLPRGDTSLFQYFHCIALQCFLCEFKLNT